MINLEQVDHFLDKLRTARDDDELRRFFRDYSAQYDDDVPADPFGQEYRDRQFSLYSLLAKKKYSPDNEVTQFDFADAAIRPFPYVHGSSDTVGNQLMAIGYLIKKMNLPKGSRILEFGPGWGNTTLALAKMGYQVTAVDIEKNFVELIRRRAAMEKLEIEVIQGDFSHINSTEKIYDAILFFECFHHAQDHLALMQGFDRVLDKNGIVCFGAEPVLDDFPIPWGVRMDGESLWAIRNNGWLELGFNKKYFFSALDRFGWSGYEHVGLDGPWSKVIIARRATEVSKLYTFATGELRNVVGTLKDGCLETSFDDEGYVAFGPYGMLPAGSWKAEIEFDEAFSRSGNLFVDVVDKGGAVIVASEKKYELAQSDSSRCNVYFVNQQQLECFEMRIRCEKLTRVRIQGIRLDFVSV